MVFFIYQGKTSPDKYHHKENHTMKKLIALILTVLSLVSCIPFAAPVSAADEPGLYANVGASPLKANASVTGPLESNDVIYAGQLAYLNVSATHHYKLATSKFYVCAPNSSSFTYVGGYTARSFFRYSSTEFRFEKTGAYTVRCDITLTDGRTASGTWEVYVSAAPKDTFNPVWPCKNANYISTMYRYWNGGSPSSHGVRSNKYNAFDVAGSYGDSILAIEAGKVVEKGYQSGGFGYYVVVEHANGLRSLYGHLKSSAIVSKGVTVTRGQVLGYMGSTGRSTGTHLHFELYSPTNYSKVINPFVTYYQNKVNVTVGGNSYKANSRFASSDSAAAAWCNWLTTRCTKNRNGDYVFTK